MASHPLWSTVTSWQTPALLAQPGWYGASVTALAATPHGQQGTIMVLGLHNGHLLVWAAAVDAQGHWGQIQLQRVLVGHQAPVVALHLFRYAPDQRSDAPWAVLSVAKDGEAKLIALDDGRCLAHTSCCVPAGVVPTGITTTTTHISPRHPTLVFVCGTSTAVTILDAGSLATLAVWQSCHTNWVSALACTQSVEAVDAVTLVAGTVTGALHVWSVAVPRLLHQATHFPWYPWVQARLPQQGPPVCGQPSTATSRSETISSRAGSPRLTPDSTAKLDRSPPGSGSPAALPVHGPSPPLPSTAAFQLVTKYAKAGDAIATLVLCPQREPGAYLLLTIARKEARLWHLTDRSLSEQMHWSMPIGDRECLLGGAFTVGGQRLLLWNQFGNARSLPMPDQTKDSANSAGTLQRSIFLRSQAWGRPDQSHRAVGTVIHDPSQLAYFITWTNHPTDPQLAVWDLVNLQTTPSSELPGVPAASKLPNHTTLGFKESLGPRSGPKELVSRQSPAAPKMTIPLVADPRPRKASSPLSLSLFAFPALASAVSSPGAIPGSHDSLPEPTAPLTEHRGAPSSRSVSQSGGAPIPWRGEDKRSQFSPGLKANFQDLLGSNGSATSNEPAPRNGTASLTVNTEAGRWTASASASCADTTATVVPIRPSGPRPDATTTMRQTLSTASSPVIQPQEVADAVPPLIHSQLRRPATHSRRTSASSDSSAAGPASTHGSNTSTFRFNGRSIHPTVLRMEPRSNRANAAVAAPHTVRLLPSLATKILARRFASASTHASPTMTMVLADGRMLLGMSDGSAWAARPSSVWQIRQPGSPMVRLDTELPPSPVTCVTEHLIGHWSEELNDYRQTLRQSRPATRYLLAGYRTGLIQVWILPPTARPFAPLEQRQEPGSAVDLIPTFAQFAVATLPVLRLVALDLPQGNASMGELSLPLALSVCPVVGAFKYLAQTCFPTLLHLALATSPSKARHPRSVMGMAKRRQNSIKRKLGSLRKWRLGSWAGGKSAGSVVAGARRVRSRHGSSDIKTRSAQRRMAPTLQRPTGAPKSPERPSPKSPSHSPISPLPPQLTEESHLAEAFAAWVPWLDAIDWAQHAPSTRLALLWVASVVHHLEAYVVAVTADQAVTLVSLTEMRPLITTGPLPAEVRSIRFHGPTNTLNLTVNDATVSAFTWPVPDPFFDAVAFLHTLVNVHPHFRPRLPDALWEALQATTPEIPQDAMFELTTTGSATSRYSLLRDAGSVVGSSQGTNFAVDIKQLLARLAAPQENHPSPSQSLGPGLQCCHCTAPLPLPPLAADSSLLCLSCAFAAARDWALVVLATHHAWGGDPELDDQCRHRLGLNPPCDADFWAGGELTPPFQHMALPPPTQYALNSPTTPPPVNTFESSATAGPEPDDLDASSKFIWYRSGAANATRLVTVLAVARALLTRAHQEHIMIPWFTYYTTLLPDAHKAQFMPPRLALLVQFWQDEWAPVQHAARAVVGSVLQRMSPLDQTQFIEFWQHFVPPLPLDRWPTDGWASIDAVLLLAMVGADEQTWLSTELLRQVAHALLLVLRSSASTPRHKRLAVELYSRGFSSWEPFVEATTLIRCLVYYAADLHGPAATLSPPIDTSSPQALSGANPSPPDGGVTTTPLTQLASQSYHAQTVAPAAALSSNASAPPSSRYPDLAVSGTRAHALLSPHGRSASASSHGRVSRVCSRPRVASHAGTVPSTNLVTPSLDALARHALLRITAMNPALMASTLASGLLLSSYLKERKLALRALTLLVHKRASVLGPFVARLVKPVVQSLDPRVPEARKAMVGAVTQCLQELVRAYPNLAFHSSSQKLAVGTLEGAVVVYDLRTATPSLVLEGHRQSIAAVEFSRDGRYLASYSIDDGRLAIWETTTNLLTMLASSLFASVKTRGRSLTHDSASSARVPSDQTPGDLYHEASSHGGVLNTRPSKVFTAVPPPPELGQERRSLRPLDGPRIDWPLDRTVRLRSHESVFTFAI
ncbi:hypothetical protein H4R34_000196 [Dimargaris verticillata]|uniref:Uncharacterized protein n=1 Tax=Dimargaris verticillata TaxID=2761393 RepID=A0A9W8B5P2_9FUNG|nr:hypothetical protein H4R34_000196 [Dimargaris verticillata]